MVLLTGATGYLGRVVATRLAPRARVVTDRLELTDREAVAAALETLRPTAVIHTAACNPGGSDNPPGRFWSVNAEGSAALADAVAKLGEGACRLVHMSTDVVHDGTAAPYADDAPPSPLGDYGRSKAAAEAAVASRMSTAAIVRTSLIYGLDRVDRATASAVGCLRGGRRLRLYRDVIRQPAHVDAVADALITLALDRPDVAGTLNVTGDEPMDRATFGRLLLDWWQVADLPANGIDVVAAAGVATDVPLDLRLRLDRARALGLATPGVTEVFRRAPGGEPPLADAQRPAG